MDSCDLTRKEREKVIELLAKAYVETGDNDEADETINKLLEKYPNYELKEAENPEMFNRLVKRYKIHPLLTIGAKNTANWLSTRP
jgi:FimV-like protein